MTETLAETFAKFSVALTSDDIPGRVRQAARWHVIDSIGVCIAGANPQEESGQVAARLAGKWRSTEGAQMFGLGTRSRPELAALLNGSLIQALEMDDKHGSSLARPGSTVIPAVLAAAEAGDAKLGHVLDAISVGYEVMIRLGFVAGKRFLERGYHTSSLLGSFGVAAAMGRLLGATPRQIGDALGICGTFASGIQESTRTGSTSKILHGGWGAHAGMLALDLAMAGISGPDTVFEGKFGFFETHLTPITGALDFARAADGLGQFWHLPDTAYKPYPCCQLLHAFIVAAKDILGEFRKDGLALSDVTEIRCQLAEPGLTLVTEPRARKKEPQTPHEARFSLFFTVAAALVDGDVGLETFQRSRLGDPAILRLAALTEASVDPHSDYPQHCPARLTIEAGDKAYFKHVPYHPGSPEAALSEDDVLDKFERNTGWLFGTSARTVARQMSRLDDAIGISELVGLLDQASQIRSRAAS